MTSEYEQLQELHEQDPELRWYAHDRLQALARRELAEIVAEGLQAASTTEGRWLAKGDPLNPEKDWNPALSPRGRDGRFIHTRGWYRWMFKGKWHVGQVQSIDPKTGLIRLLPKKNSTYTGRAPTFFTPFDARTRLYRVADHKAALEASIGDGPVQAAAEVFTDSSMIALIPTNEDSARLAVEDFEPAKALHLTLVFMGKATDVEGRREALTEQLRELASGIEPLTLKAWATADFNPTENPCACYLIGGENGADLRELRDDVLSIAAPFPDQYDPFVPHVAIGYKLTSDKLKHAGTEITFDRLRLAVGEVDVDIPLGAGDGPKVEEDVVETVTASTTSVESMIDTAIELPEMRWWVERRLVAMGVDIELPWEGQ